jgi:hypothetical protein
VPQLVSEPVADLATAVGKLRADDRLTTSPEMVLGDIEVVLEAISTVQAVLVRRLRAALELDAAAAVTGRSTKGFLHEECLLAAAEAGRLMRLVRTLPFAPVTEAAFDAGEITASHAAAITTALATIPAELRDTIEPHLVDRARQCPPEEIAAFTDQLLTRLGIDNASDIRRERRLAQRGLEVGATLHGHRHVAGTLSPDVGTKLEQALALASQPAGREDHRTRRQRQHDALGEIADTYLNAHAAGTPAFVGAPRAVMVTLDWQTLEHELTDRWLTLPDGATISAHTARRLACDAALIPVVLAGASEPLDIGVADHEFTAAIRRAAWIRDRGQCAFPDCRNRPADAHHIKFRRHHGPTNLDNCAWLCTFHHWLAHEGRWHLQRQPHDHSYLWTGPAGQQKTRHLKPDRHP